MFVQAVVDLNLALGQLLRVSQSVGHWGGGWGGCADDDVKEEGEEEQGFPAATIGRFSDMIIIILYSLRAVFPDRST